MQHICQNKEPQLNITDCTWKDTGERKRKRRIFFSSQRIHFLLHYFFLSHVAYQFYFTIPLQKNNKTTNLLLCFSEMQNVVMIISLPFIIYSAFELKIPTRRQNVANKSFTCLLKMWSAACWKHNNIAKVSWCLFCLGIFCNWHF